MKRYFLLILFLISACATNHTDDYVKYRSINHKESFSYDNIAIFLNSEQKVDFRGSFETDNSVNSNQILYQGGAGVGGLIAQVFIHASMTASQQNEKLRSQQEQANRVLDSFVPLLNTFFQKDLETESELVYFPNIASIKNDIYILSKPIFFLSQDSEHVILKHKISVIKTDQKKPIYENLIEVVSLPKPKNLSWDKIGRAHV